MKKNLHRTSSFSFRRMLANTRKLIQTISLLLLFVFLGTIYASAQEIQESAMRQIKSLMDEKETRTPAQKKINSQILYTYKMRNGQPLTSEVATLQTDIVKDADGKIKVDIDANVTPQLLNSLKAMGCEIIFSSEKFRNIVANIPLGIVEQVALLDAIKHINPWIAPVNNSNFSNLMRVDKAENANNFRTLNLKEKHNNNSVIKSKYAPDFTSRAENVKKQLNEALGQRESNGMSSVMSFVALATSEGDITHKAALARAVFGMNGSGVKIGVISDSYDTRTTGTNAADDIASGDLPGPGNPNGFTTPVTVLLDSPNGTDEGRAMLQIIHDLAPGAELYFATAFVSQASFAEQIIALQVAGCDIIVDDVNYFVEAVFQDDNVAQAVNRVTASGALYFSSAGNSGNKNDNTSGVWEGDFLDAGTATIGPVTIAGGTFHDFSGGVTNNQITLEARVPSLKWSDPLGASGNDYDLYILDNALTTIVVASTDIQDGNDNPVEALFYVIQAGYRIVIFKKTGAAVRALHLNTNRGRLNFNTPGVTYGHNAAAAAYTVAATPAVTPGPYPGAFNPANSVETFSSDGPRRIFFNPDSTEITPGNVLFGTDGGTLLQKPDITAADGVVTSTPGFARFYGTSAAAPHAAAIAALIKSKLPALTPAEVRTALTSSAIDIEAPGSDRDAGAGIIMAYEALLAAGATPTFSNLDLGTVTAVEGAYGNGNGTLESGELGSMTVQLMNLSPSVSADDVNAVLTCSTPGVTITRGAADYGDIAGAGSAVNTATPYLFGVNSSISCGAVINFTLTVTIGSGETSPKEFNFTVSVGSAAGTISATLGSPPPSGPGYVSLSGTQTGRINRLAPPSTCAVPKVAPGYASSTGSRAYHAYTFTNSNASSQCVSVSMNSTNGSVLFTAAYNNAGFVPATPNVNYLADASSSSNAALYSFTVPAGEQFTVVVHEVNAGGGVGTSYELNVGLNSCDATPLCTDVVISTASIQNGITGLLYNQSFSATGGSGSYLFSLSGTLPDGLSFSGNTLSGTATQTGSFPIIVTATDATGCPQGTQNYTLDIAAPTITTIVSNLNPSLTGNTVAFTATVTSNGNPVVSGTVTFSEDITILSGPTAVNPDGQTSFLISSFAAGNHEIKATYDGTAEFAASNGTVTQIVNDPVVTYSITTSAGAGGSITASSTVNSGDNATVTVKPDDCYHIVSVLVDGVAADLSALNLNLPYDVIFSNVNTNHTVDATFAINTYDIIASAGANGTITPTGSTTLNCADDQTYTITADACYQVADVLVDGVSQGAITTYTFTNVTMAHTISATFTQLTYNILASSGPNGSISPNGSTTVNCGTDQTFNIAPDACYQVEDVLVDGVSQGAITTYTFINVTAAHTISASFTQLNYNIIASAGTNGTITPNGTTTVNCGDDQTFTIAPDACYQIETVLVDGVNNPAAVSSGTYTFTNVTATHTISATFSQLSYTITGSAGANGSITPNGTTNVNCGASQTYTIVPGGGFAVQNVLVDGVSQGAITMYTFSNVTAPHTISVTFVASAVCSATGNISYQVWNNIGSSKLVSSLTSNSNYPDYPTSTSLITSMEGITNLANEFGARIVGYICAPSTGSYTFWIASDDYSELWLSTTDNTSDKQLIAYHTGATLPRQWNKYTTQKSISINLVQGQKYFIEALMKEGSGNDNLAVGWLKPGQSGTVPSEVVPGSVLSPILPIQLVLVSSVALPPSSIVNVGATVLIPTTVLPDNASNKTLDWSTSNPAIATVNSSGLVSGMAVGTATITATSKDGSNKSGSCIVTINPVAATCSATGTITYQVWNNIGSSKLVSSLTNNSNYPDYPTSTSLITSMEGITNLANEFGARIVGYICAPSTGSYTFWIASDDYSELWLSTTDNTSDKQLIAYHTGATLPRQWNKYTTQKSISINLVQGQKYFIEALMKEGAGNDNLAVGWLKPGQSGTIPSEVVPGSVLSPFLPVQLVLVSSVALPPSSIVNVGATVLIPSTVLPDNASNKTLDWSTSNPAIVIVNSNGLVSGMSVGTATITATSKDGSNKSGSCIVTVNPVAATCSATGTITYQVWQNIGSSKLVSSLTSNSNYPDYPTSTSMITSMEGITNLANEFGARIVGYICAPSTGSYTFWIASDDYSELWLSTTDKTSDKQLIAYHTGATLPRQWNKYATQKSISINLVQGQKYFIEALMKEGSGNDNLAVGWLKPGQSGTVPSEVVPGSVLSPLAGTLLSPLASETKIAEIKVKTSEISKQDVTLFVYPNPVTDNNAVNIKLENLTTDATLRIFTVSGIKCYEKVIQSSGIIQVDRSVFKNGMYIIKVENEDFVKTTKLIIN